MGGLAASDAVAKAHAPLVQRAAAKRPREILAIEQLHGHVVLSAVFAKIVKGHDVRVIEPGRRLGQRRKRWPISGLPSTAGDMVFMAT